MDNFLCRKCNKPKGKEEGSCKCGRPLKFETVGELNGKEDGDYEYMGERIVFSDFKKESDLVGFVCRNINDFARIYLKDEVVSYEVDKPISAQRFLSPRGRRIDLFIEGKNGIYIIEAKNAENTTEIRYAIGQLLDYGREYNNLNKELILLSNLYDSNTIKTIKFYNLPIRYLVFNKKQGLEFYGTR